MLNLRQEEEEDGDMHEYYYYYSGMELSSSSASFDSSGPKDCATFVLQKDLFGPKVDLLFVPNWMSALVYISICRFINTFVR